MIRRIISSALVGLLLATPALADLSQYGGPKPRPTNLVIVGRGGADLGSTLQRRVIDAFNNTAMTNEAFQRQMRAARDMELPKSGAYYDSTTGKMRTR